MYIMWVNYLGEVDLFSTEFIKFTLKGSRINASVVDGPAITNLSSAVFKSPQEASKVFNEMASRLSKLERLDGDSVEMDVVFNVNEWLSEEF